MTDEHTCVFCGEPATDTVLIKRTKRSYPVEHPACTDHAERFGSQPATLAVDMQVKGQMNIYDVLDGEGV